MTFVFYTRNDIMDRVFMKILKVIFIMVFLSFLLVETTPTNAQESYYYFNAEPLFFYRYPYNFGAIGLTSPPPGKTFLQLASDYDVYVFLLSIAGNVNRVAPTFLIRSRWHDETWVNLLVQQGIWLAGWQRRTLGSITEVISTFQNPMYGIRGSVVWEADRPYTLNLAWTVAGVENLVVVRKNSSHYAQITQAFPVVKDLSLMNLTSKSVAYRWLTDTYLKTKKTAPLFNFMPDGSPVRQYGRGKIFIADDNLHIEGWGISTADFSVVKRAFVFDVANDPRVVPLDEPDQPTGEDYNTFQYILSAIAQTYGTNGLKEFWGFPSRKYLTTDCNGDGQVGEADMVYCGEFAFVKGISGVGGVLRIGGGEAYGTEAPNISFYQHGPKPVQPQVPVKPALTDYFTKGWVIGYPLNPSFEQGDANWTMNTTNRVVYTNAQAAFQGQRYLEANVSSTDLSSRNDFFQDIPVNAKKGNTYAFVIAAQRGSDTVSGRQVVWGQAGGEFTLLCQNRFTIDWNGWQDMRCQFTATRDYDNLRLQVFLDSPNYNYRFDRAMFLGAYPVILNTDKQFVLFYVGDYDFAMASYVVPMNATGIFFWPNRGRTTVPLAWGFSIDTYRDLGPMYAYYAKTAAVTDTFVMPDSGYGYANPGYMTGDYATEWVKVSANANRQLGYKYGWMHNGDRSAVITDGSEEGVRIRTMYRAITPQGVLYNAGPHAAKLYDFELPIIGMSDVTYAGKTPSLAASDLVGQLGVDQFGAFRAVFVSHDHLSELVDIAKQQNPRIEVVDPGTFFQLFSASRGGAPSLRATLVSQTTPAVTVGSQTTLSLTFRNDGFDIWRTQRAGQSGCDDSGLWMKGCYAFGISFSAEEVVPAGLGVAPTTNYSARAHLTQDVYPGETVTIDVPFTIANYDTSYTLQVDIIHELYTWGESKGNVPYQRVFRIDRLLAGDVRQDGVVNVWDYLSVAFQATPNIFQLTPVIANYGATR